MNENALQDDCRPVEAAPDRTVELSASELIEIASLRTMNSPRSAGESDEHIKMMAELDVTFPPIIVHRATMGVVDGMHRVAVARLRGQTHILAVYFDGTDAEAFVLAVRTNIEHGLPLGKRDRLAAATRILEMHPDWSDRFIASSAGLSHTTIANIRRRVSPGIAEAGARRGRDGCVRPLDNAEGRIRASELIAAAPGATVRQIARDAGISPATAHDVRNRMRRGEDPVPVKRRAIPPSLKGSASSTPDALLKLQRDPSLRSSEAGRILLRLLLNSFAQSTIRQQLVADLPPHCVDLAARAARECATNWQEFSGQLRERWDLSQAIS